MVDATLTRAPNASTWPAQLEMALVTVVSAPSDAALIGDVTLGVFGIATPSTDIGLGNRSPRKSPAIASSLSAAPATTEVSMANLVMLLPLA